MGIETLVHVFCDQCEVQLKTSWYDENDDFCFGPDYLDNRTAIREANAARWSVQYVGGWRVVCPDCQGDDVCDDNVQQLYGFTDATDCIRVSIKRRLECESCVGGVVNIIFLGDDLELDCPECGGDEARAEWDRIMDLPGGP